MLSDGKESVHLAGRTKLVQFPFESMPFEFAPPAATESACTHSVESTLLHEPSTAVDESTLLARPG